MPASLSRFQLMTRAENIIRLYVLRQIDYHDPFVRIPTTILPSKILAIDQQAKYCQIKTF